MRTSWSFRINIAISLICLGVVSGLCYNGWIIFSEFAEQLSALPSAGELSGMPDAAEGHVRAVYMLAASVLAAVWFTALLSSIVLHDLYLRNRWVQLAYQLSGTVLLVVFDVLAGLAAGTAWRWQRFFDSYHVPLAASACHTVWLMIIVSMVLVSLLYVEAVVLTLRNSGLFGRRQARLPQDPPRPFTEAPSIPARSSRSSSVEFELDPLSTRNRHS
ncbi:hypothetical protein F4775DRAFT_608171 [Biscogniauxia sp. FL1348]|nr:hypothetical protein F4775DRAFT_608171 [Biscogniauxia sp. FL1348]